MPEIRTYAELDDGQLEELLRERAFKVDAELRVHKVDASGEEVWRAAFQVYDLPAELASEGASKVAVESSSKRAALVALAQTEDIDRMQREWKEGQRAPPPPSPRVLRP
jgi:hypothetical protein